MPKREAIENDKKHIEISISHEVAMYCYKADNFYDFSRRVYLLRELMQQKLQEEMILHESKKA